MEHTVREDRGVLVVGFDGDVDLENSPQARQVLLECVNRAEPVVVDMSGVSYIDSSGVASLIEAFQAAREAGQFFSLAALSDAAFRVLNLARLDKVFTIHDTVGEGVAEGAP